MRQKTRFISLIGCLFLFTSVPWGSLLQASPPVRVALKFRPGRTLKFVYEETLSYTPPAKFVELSGYTLQDKVHFKMQVNDVSEDGEATVRITLERLTVTLDGSQIADLTVFPKKATRLSATIKPNGEARFYKDFYLTVNNGGQLEFRVAKEGSPIATKTVSTRGSEKIEYAADLDEAHGVIRDGVPPTRNLPSPEYGKMVEFKVDMVPVKLFELINLPTVALAEGQFFSIPLKYLGHEKLTYQGQADVAGHSGSKMVAEVTPWTETSDGTDGGLQPALSGNISYVIDSSGKLIQGKANLSYEIIVPGVGPQKANTKIVMTLKR